MIKAKIMVPVFVLLGSLLGCTAARPGRILSQEEFGNNYCHTRYRAPGSAADYRNGPGDIIDFYGPCDETRGELGWENHLFRQRQFGKEYGS